MKKEFKVGDRVAFYSGGDRKTGVLTGGPHQDGSCGVLINQTYETSAHYKQLRRLRKKKKVQSYLEMDLLEALKKCVNCLETSIHDHNYVPPVRERIMGDLVYPHRDLIRRAEEMLK